MGFFSKIKQNFKHGGVKVKIQAPASVSMQDANVPVTVNITATDSQAVVSSVKVEIIAESRNQAFGAPSSSGASQAQTTQQVVARADNNEVLTLAPGETKQVPISIIMNQGAAIEAQLPQGGAAAGVAHALGQLQSLSEHLNQNSYTYYIQAVANVEGIALDPSDRQPIQILKPGQVGTGLNIKL